LQCVMYKNQKEWPWPTTLKAGKHTRHKIHRRGSAVNAWGGQGLAKLENKKKGG